MFATQVSSFLLNKMKELNLKKNELADHIGISAPLLSELLNERKQYPALKTLTKIADSFNIQIDQVLGRKEYISSTTPSIISIDSLYSNLKIFISSKIESEKIKINDLAKFSGMTQNSLKGFLNGNSNLGTATISKLSTYWKVPIDEMIGRSTPAKDLSVTQKEEDLVNSLSNKDDLTKLDKIKTNLKTISQTYSPSVTIKDKIINSKLDKPKSFVERLNQERANKSKDRQL